MVESLKISDKTAYVTILTMGIVSMLGDIIYEPGRESLLTISGSSVLKRF